MKLPFEKKVWVVKMAVNSKANVSTYEAIVRSGVVGLFTTKDQAVSFAKKMNEERKDRNFDYLLDEMVWGLG